MRYRNLTNRMIGNDRPRGIQGENNYLVGRDGSYIISHSGEKIKTK